MPRPTVTLFSNVHTCMAYAPNKNEQTVRQNRQCSL